MTGAVVPSLRHTKHLMWAEPEAWQDLMERLVKCSFRSRLPTCGGAAAIQVLKAGVGVLAPSDYERLSAHPGAVRRIRAEGSPVIHFGTGNGTFLEVFNSAGGDVLGLDWRVDLGSAWARVGHGVAVQGNLDPIALLAPLPALKAKVHAILDSAAARPGHIFNLGHGIIPETPVENVRAVVRMVRDYAAEPRQ